MRAPNIRPTSGACAVALVMALVPMAQASAIAPQKINPGLAAEIEKAYNEENKDRSVELWQGIFGDGFKAPATSSNSTKFPAAPVPATTVGRSGRAG